MLNAAKKIADGDEKAAKVLGGLTNCKTCHDTFKG
jgi:cytochrome c556